MNRLKVNFAGVELKNPIIMASGTFGFGKEYNEIYDVNILGGISSKGLTLEAKAGNDGIRSTETPYGMMNSVGLENPGIKGFLKNEFEFFRTLDTARIVNVGGKATEDYIESVKLLDKEKDIDIIELNISCPNVKEGGMAFGIEACSARAIVKEIRAVTSKVLVVKLSPNARDIVEIAKVCEEEGADGISLINTVKALAIDIKNRKPVFGNVYAGLSGPAIKPIALRMVHEVCKAVSIPVMGMGGISNYEDVIEFIMAGATCVQIGTQNFVDLETGPKIIKDLEDYMERENIKSLDEIRGII